MAGNGVNLGVGIDLSQFQKDISYVNKELKDISKLEVVAKMKIGLPKGKLKKEVEEAQKELDMALNSLKTIKRNGTPIELFNMKDVEKEVKRLGGELKKATATGDKYMENRISSEIAKLNNVVIAAGKMSNVMSKAGLASTPKASAINKSERAELGEQIKLLQKKRDLLTGNASIDESSKLKEDKRLLGEIVKLEERREATYKSGSSKAGQKRLNAYREESLGLDRAELDRQIKQLEKRRELLRQDFKLSSKDRLNEERKILHQIIGLIERREATYKSGSSKAGQERLSQLRQEASALKQQGTLFGSLGRFAAQYFSLYSAWNVVKQIFDVTKELQRQQVALEGIVGSAVEATKAMSGLKAMALESPFNLKELIGYTKQLAAYGIEVEELLPTTSKLADLSAGLGVDMSRLILAYGQVNAASVLRGQELRQFTEAGVPMVDKLAQKFSDLNGRLVTTGEVFDMISKRQVSFEMVSQVLTDMTSEGGEFYKMQENLTDTLYGQFEKLKDTWTISLKGIGDEMEGVFRTALKLAMNLSKNLGGVILAISSAGIGKALKSIVPYLSVATKSLGDFIIRLKLAIKHSYGILYAFRSIGKALISNAGIAALSMIIGLIINAVRKSKEWEREINKINESFAKDTAKLTVGFDKLVNKISTASENTKEFADAVSTLKSNYGDFVNDNIVQALINEARAAKEAGNEYRALAESIKASIEAKKEYERHETLKNTAAEQIMGQLNVGGIFNVTRSELAKKRETRKSEISSQEGVTSENLLSAYRDDEQLMKIYRAEEKFRSNDLESAVSQAIAQMTSSNETTIDEFTSRFEEALKTYGFNEVAIQSALGNVDKLFGKIEDTDQWKTYLSEVGVLENEESKKINDAFKSVNTELSGERYKSIVGDRKGGNYNPLAIDKEEQRLYIEKYTGLLESLLSPEQFNKLAADKGYQSALEIDDEDYGKGKALREAIFEYQKTLVSPQKNGESDEDYEKRKKVEQDVFNTIQNISNAFLEFAGTIGETADGIRSNGAQLRGFEKLNLSSEEKDMLTPYLKVTEENVEQQQKALWSELDRLDEFIKKNENNEQFKGRVDDAKRIKDILTVLTDKNLYYGKKPENENAGGNKNKYEKLRTTDFFDEWLSLITKAEDDMKKIVGVTGYTDELGNFVNQLSKENYLKAFFEEGGNPFEDIFAKMTKAGITEFLPEFNQETLKNIFREAGWEEGKEISIPDFKSMYETVVNTIGDQVIAGLKTKRDQYAKGTSERNSLEAEIDRWQEAQAKYIKTMTARWDSDEIEKKLESMIKELTDINGNFEKQKSQRDMFERIGKAGSYRDAQNAIYGEGSTPLRFDKTFAARNTALSLLGAEGGQGVASTYAGQRLTNLLSGGHLNIENLNALTDIMYDLEEQAAEMDVLSKAEGSEEAKKNAKQFGDVTKSITQIIKEMVDSIISDYEELSKYRSSDMVAGDDIVKAKNDFQTANDLINNFINQRLVDITNAYNKGEIDIDEFDRQVSNTNYEADKMRIKATQDLYNTMLTNLGGQKLPDWIIALFSENNGTTGISQGGKAMSIMNAISGQGGGIESLVAMGVQKKLEKGEYDKAEDPEAAAAEAAQKIIATIKAVGSVFSTVDQAVQVAVEMGKGVIDALNATDNRLGLSKGTDGAMYDKDGNLNIDEEYYEKQNRRDTAMQVFDTIGNFSSGISGSFQKLMQGDIFGAFAGVFTSITTLISDIAGTRDSQIRHQQEAIIRSNENLARAMEGLEDALEDAAGIDKFDVQSQQIANLQQQKQQYDMLLALENEKKNGDSAKAQEYESAAVDAQRDIDEIMDNIQNDVLGTADRLASTLTDPLVDAFRNGENAARAWRDAVKSYVSDVLKDILMTKVVAPKIQEILDQFMGDNTDSDDILSLFKDEDKVGGWVEDLNEVGTGLIDDFNNLPSSIKDLIGFNSEQSSLSGGISGITEDTARQLEGLSNSQLMQLILINRTLTQYLEAATTSSDNNQYMANVQTHLQQINNNVGLILRSITELRDTPSRPLHVTMV